MAQRPSPTVRRRRLAEQLRRLRKAAGISLEDAAEHLDISHSALSRIETGQATARTAYVDTLARLYGVDDRQREALVRLAREARQRGWWHPYNDVLNDQYAAYISFETEAVSIRTYEPQTVPGLLQTEAYARALVTAQLPEASADQVDKRVQLRMERQARVRSDDPLRLWVILGEPVLRYQVGGLDAMRQQLEHLLEVGERPHTTIQVLPYSAGAHPGMGGPFVILGFEDSADVVYLENLTSSVYLEADSEVAQYTLTYEHLRAAANNREQSGQLIQRALRELK
ncbi:helix-turn-helix domain-containing protein [Cryptosporangium sp. NPDC051539]|uniref:helix-turn-helix domain-containing protein n=1 Tax=Cryptosporangium sp. NPDC051539 TaxID=3363962 RepID=UPI00379EBC5F